MSAEFTTNKPAVMAAHEKAIAATLEALGFEFTTKGRGEYNGQKQTAITRCKVAA